MSNKFTAWFKRNEPGILTYTGTVGLIFTIGWTIKATIDATKAVDAKKKELNREKLTKKEVVSTTWKYYLPVVISTALSVPCILVGNHISGKRNTALALAYTGAESALQLTRNKLTEIAGPKTAQVVQEAVAKEQTKTVKAADSGNIVVVGDGDQLFFDPLSGRYFKTSWNKLEHAAYTLNERSTSYGSGIGIIMLNDWYEAVGLPITEVGEVLCWAPDSLGGNGNISISMSTIKTDDNQPCGSIQYKNMPVALSETERWK